MVEIKHSIVDDASTLQSPPLVAAHIIPDLASLEPIQVETVEVNAITIEEVVFDAPCEASYISIDSVVEPIPIANDTTTTTTPMDSKTMAWSAGIAGGVLGTLVGGPVLGAVAGGTAAYFTGQDGVGGDTARAMADVAQTTGQKARELNRKHSLVDKSKQAARNSWKKVKNLNSQHNFSLKGKEAASAVWDNAKDFNERHGLIEKLGTFAVLCFKRFAKFVAEVSGRLLENGQAQQQTSQQQNATKVLISPQQVSLYD